MVRRTALYEEHVKLGAKVVDFAGWEMPLQYQGVVYEHHVVRNKVGIFDVSHMGKIDIKGPQAESFLEYISTNRIKGKKEGQAVYTVLCKETGGAIDDTIVYRVQSDHFFIIANAGNRENDLRHLQHYAQDFDVDIEHAFDTHGILAVQGPQAMNVVRKIFPEVEHVKSMHFRLTSYRGVEVVLSGTGYTGSGGFEICVPNGKSVELWRNLLEAGKDLGIEPIGLGARDTLRLEMGFALYGHELSLEMTPIGSVAAWAVKLNKEHFLGKEAIQEKQSNGKHQYGVVVEEKGIPRQGFNVLYKGQRVGVVTSGNHSPTLDIPIAIVMVDCELHEGDEVSIEIRKNLVKGRVHSLPFLR